MFHVPEAHRILDDGHSELGSDSSYGNNGAFTFYLPCNSYRKLIVIASDEDGWEHVSARVDELTKFGHRSKAPNWVEMCALKDIFWDKEDVVMQLHPQESRYVNDHPDVLNLWRPVGVEIPVPPMYMV